MKAVVFEVYGPPEVLHVRELPRPEPTPEEILVGIHATTVSAGDRRMRQADPFTARLYNGLFRPMRVNILGFEFAGTVAEVGSQVTGFHPGDRVANVFGIHELD